MGMVMIVRANFPVAPHPVRFTRDQYLRMLDSMAAAPQVDRSPTLTMGNLKKKRRLKMNKHKRRKRLKANRHKKRTWQK